MNKVYLVMEYGGEWEDSYEYIIAAYFNKNKADDHKEQLDNRMSKMSKEYDKLCIHVESCEIESEECKLCDRFYDIQSELHDGKYYKVKEIEVE